MQHISLQACRDYPFFSIIPLLRVRFGRLRCIWFWDWLRNTASGISVNWIFFKISPVNRAELYVLIKLCSSREGTQRIEGGDREGVLEPQSVCVEEISPI